MDIIQSGKGRGVYSSSSKFSLVASMKNTKSIIGYELYTELCQYGNNIKRKYTVTVDGEKKNGKYGNGLNKRF